MSGAVKGSFELLDVYARIALTVAKHEGAGHVEYLESVNSCQQR